MPTFRLEMSSDSDDELTTPNPPEPVIIVLDSSSDDDESLIGPSASDSSSSESDSSSSESDSENDSFVVPDDESIYSDELSFDGLEVDEDSFESSDSEESSDDEEDVSLESDSPEESFSSDELIEEVSIWCSLCKRSYPSLSFSAQRRKMHANGANPDRIFCLNHTSTSSFGDFYAFESNSKGYAPKRVDTINNYGQNTGHRNRNVFERRGLILD